MRHLFLCGAVLLVLSFPSQSLAQRRRAQACLSYEPELVTVTGTIRTRTFAEPPNYESDAKGDAREDVWVVRLAKPLCVSAKGDAEAEKNVTDLQLVFPEGQKQYDQYRSLKGRRVSIKGTLFHAETGHHHTKVLLTVTSIRKA